MTSSREPAPEKRPAFEPPTSLLRPPGYDPAMPRPASTTAGAVLVGLRVIAGIIVLLALAYGWDDVLARAGEVIDDFAPTSGAEQASLALVLWVGGIVLLVEAVLAVFVFAGSNWARVIVMTIATLSIATSFAAWWVSEQEIGIEGTFLSLSLDILVLLALSSRRSAAYARRFERRDAD